MGFITRQYRLWRRKLLKNWIGLIWIAVCICVFYFEYIRYKKEPQYYYLQRMLGVGMYVSRGTAAVLNIACSILVFPMCRALTMTLTSVVRSLLCCKIRRRSASSAAVPPLPALLTSHGSQSAKSFHVLIALTVISASVAHTCAHISNAINFSQHFDAKYPEVNVFSRKDENAFVFFIATVPGVTGLALMMILIIIAATSTKWARRRNYNVFFYTHYMGLLFFLILIVHPNCGVLKEQKNLQNHIPGCQMVSGITIKECDEGDCKSRLDEVGKGNGNTDLFKRKICSEAPVFHSIASQTWIWVTCALLVWVTECIVRWRRQQSEIRVIDVILHPCNVVQLTLLQQGFSCSPGQYVLIQCPVISRFEWHPFTVTSCPTEYGLNTFSILMRAQGDWSNQLLGLLRSFIPSRQESSESMLNNSTIIYSSITSQNEQYSNRSTVLPHLCYYPYVHNHQTSRNLLLEESPQLYPPSRRQTNLECRYMLHVPLEFSDSISDLQCYCENSKALCSCVERDNFNAFNNCAKDLHSPNCVQESETRLVKKPLVQVESPFCAPKRKINSVTVCSDSKSAQACELNYNLSHSSKVTCNSISCLCFHNAFPYFLSGVSRNHSKQLIKNTCHDMRKLPTNHKSKRNETRAFSYIIKKSRTKCDTLCDSAEENREKKNYTDEIWHSSLISLKIDGPYCSSGEEMLQYPVIISVAGGIGITPLAAALSHKIWHPKMWPRRIHIVWVVRDAHFILVIAPLLSKILHQCWHTNLEDSIELRLYVTLPATLESLQSHLSKAYPSLLPRITKGRPHWNHLFEEWRNIYSRKNVGVFTCGPRKMCEEVKRHCLLAVSHGGQFHYHQESYS